MQQQSPDTWSMNLPPHFSQKQNQRADPARWFWSKFF